MYLTSFPKGLLKEIYYSCVILSTYLFVGVSRSYLTFLFYQLDSPGSSITVDDEQKSWMAAFINLLSPLGCIVAGIAMDAYGRRISVQGNFLPYLISWLMIAFAKNVSMLYIAALIQSIGSGMSLITSTYVSEISTAEHRGALLGSVDIVYCFGILLCNLLMYCLPWHIVAFIFTGICTIFLLLTNLLPESPTWLYLKGRHEESIKALISIRCQDRDKIKSEIDDMENYMLSYNVKMKFNETLKNCLRAWRQFFIAIFLFILSQNTGYAVMILYIIMIVDRFNIPYSSTDIALLYSVTSSISGFVTPYVMYKFNRKPTLAISAFGMSFSIAVVPIYNYIFESYDEKPFPWIIPVAMCTYVVFSSIGVCPFCFTIAGELFPNEVRGVLNGVYGAVAYFYSSLLYKIIPWYLATFEASGVMWTFAAFSMLTAIFTLFVLPETKGKTLNEVQEEYFKKKG